MYNVTSVKEAGAIVAALEDIKDAMEGGYPEPTSATDGQVLTADGQGGASWEDAQSGVPAVTSSDDGKVLTADYTGGVGTYSWEDAPQGVPDTTGVTNGYVLTNNNGTPTWAAASGGGGGVGFVDNTVIEVTFNDKDETYVLDYHPLTAGTNIFNAKSVDRIDSAYLTWGRLSLIVGHGLLTMPKTIITEAHLENINGISGVSDIIPIYAIEQYSGLVYLYYDTTKITSFAYYKIVINGVYDTTT